MFTKSGIGRRIPTPAASLPVVLLVSFVLAASPARVHAQTGAEAVAAGAAVAGVVLQAIGGLATWVNSQDDDCSVAALGAAWGKDCNLNKEECTDTGYYWASCNATGDNGCAHGFGSGFASESAVGSWGGCTISPFALAYTKALHTTDDSHHGRGWAKASVDGTGRVQEEATPDAPSGFTPVTLASRRDPDGRLVPAASADWPLGSIVAMITVDTLSLRAGTIGAASARYSGSVTIDGVVVWSATASLDGTGAVLLGGALAGTPYTSWFDPATGRWEMRIYGYQYEHYVGTFEITGAPGGTATTARDVAVAAEGEIDADAGNASTGNVPTYVTTTPTMIHTNDPFGEPMLKGQYVQVPYPLVVTSMPNQFGGPLPDYHLFDPQSGKGLGVLDFRAAPPLHPGQQVMVRGAVTHHDGRTVLIDTEIVPMGLFGPPPVQPIPASYYRTNAEQLENSRVTLVEPVQYLGNQPVGAGDIVTWYAPAINEYVETYLDPDAGPWPTIMPGTMAQVGGFVLQSDPEPVEHSPAGPTASPAAGDPAPLAAGAPGYFDGYYLRPAGPADIQLSTAGTGEPARPGLPNRPFELAQNEPNPFNPVTRIAFRLDQPAPVQLRIFTITGRLVRTLAEGPLASGTHEYGWDGRDDAGQSLPSGLYLYTLDVAGIRETKKMMMIQ